MTIDKKISAKKSTHTNSAVTARGAGRKIENCLGRGAGRKIEKCLGRGAGRKFENAGAWGGAKI